MPVEVTGIDHIYLAVADMRRSEHFYDRVMTVLGYRKSLDELDGAPHIHYYNRQFGFTLRPAKPGTLNHDSYAPGLHHFRFRVESIADVSRAAEEMAGMGIEVTKPQYFPEYDKDYYAAFFNDPDGIRLEITNFRESRRQRMNDWERQQ